MSIIWEHKEVKWVDASDVTKWRWKAPRYCKVYDGKTGKWLPRIKIKLPRKVK